MDPLDIQYELKKRNVLQSQIAAEAGVHPVSISKVIKGKMTSPRLMDLIAAHLGKDPREVFARYPAKQVTDNPPT